MKVRIVGLAAVAILTAAIGACSGGSDKETAARGGAALQPADDGAQLTMWTRAATGDYAKRLVDAYNKSHKNQIKLTVTDDGQYQQRVAAAAGGRNLPDLLSSDVIYMPNYTSKGIFADITTSVRGLAFADKVAPSHIELATWKNKVYGLPFKLDASALFYNKDLFTKAGLDPERPPTTYQEMIQAATAIKALGGGVHGISFAGACPGCEAYTVWPHVWASGGQVFTEEGAKATFDSPEVRDALQLYADMWRAGVVAPASKTESGPTWMNAFATGKIGMAPIGSFALGNYKEKARFDFGVAGFPGKTGGTSSFIGGDAIGISANSGKQAQAWDFLNWTMASQAQVDVVAANGDLPVRSDFADNPHAAKDPRIVTLGKLIAVGKTPNTRPYGELVNDVNGDWLPMFQTAVFGGDVAGATAKGNKAMQAVLDAN